MVISRLGELPRRDRETRPSKKRTEEVGMAARKKAKASKAKKKAGKKKK